MEIPTAFGTTYKVNIPEETPAEFTDSVPMYVAPNGDVYSKFYNLLDKDIKTQGENKRPIPDPSNFNTIQEYKRAIWDYYFQFNDLKASYILPVPVGFSFQRLAECHVPTIQEKTPYTPQNRLAAKTFSVVNTPLYPANYLSLCSSIISGIPIKEEYFPAGGPRNEKIPIKYHFQPEVPWNSKLILQKPVAQSFKTYEEYAYAMRKWYEITSKQITIPLHSIDMEPILNIHATIEEPPTPIQIVKEPVQIKQFPVSLSFDESKLKEPISKLWESYSKFIQPDSHEKIEFPAFQETCRSIAVSCIEFGCEDPFSYNKLFKGLSICHFSEIPESISSLSSTKPHIQMLIDTYESTSSFEVRYFIFCALRAVFAQGNSFVESIISDLQLLYRAYLIIAEFTDSRKDIVPYYNIDSLTYGEHSGFLSTIQNIFMSFHICSHLKDLYGDPIFGDKKGYAFFTKYLHLLTEPTESFLGYHYARISQIFNSIKDDAFACDILCSILSSGIKHVSDVIQSFSPPIFVYLNNLSKRSPRIFLKITNKIIESQTLRVLFLEQFTQFNGFLDLIADNTEYIRFLENLMHTKVSPNSPANDLSWILLFVSNLINMGSINDSLYRLFYSVFTFCHTILITHPINNYESEISQLESVTFSALIIEKENSGKIIIIRSMKKIMFHKSSALFLKGYKTFINELLKLMKSEDIKVQTSVFRVIRDIIIYHPKVLAQIIDDVEMLKAVANILPSRNWRKLIQVFKMILRYPKANKDMNNLETLFYNANFKITSSINICKRNVDNRHQHIISELEQLLTQRNSPIQFLLRVENGEKRRFSTFRLR
ncbi:hypothetical protein GPJ56_009357 [Histomonas meleagridis]|uniref:uncharacterized protein n=1 Tax=Histomonas meleagridis TaxID=135588 RepID=UPI003559D507|nr:hypothetical protein GPJ56_009357 [Histomonas meleagridis]KAH0797309.1 hypothetical protein GO595_009991 [Histomonas meleagridis]